jgi:uncharacterized protein (TIGR00288 family)
LTFYQNRFSSLPNALTPYVLKKSSKSVKAKGVDIRMCVDVLHHTVNDNLDAVLLLTGDGDFLPLVHEVIRAGKQLYVAAFSEGLNEEIRRAADQFQCLDGTMFVDV